MSRHDSPSAVPPEPEPAPTLLRQGVQFLGSLHLALLLLAVIMVASVVGTLLESRFDAAVARSYVYQAPWFGGWLVLLIVNLSCSVFARWPLRRDQWGFAITHLGIVVILLGAIIGKQWGIEGNVTLHAGQQPLRQMVIDERLLEVRPDRMGPQPARIINPALRPPTEERPLSWDVGGFAVSVLEYAGDLGSGWTVRENAEGGRRLLDVTVFDGQTGRSAHRWLAAGVPGRDELDLEAGRVRWLGESAPTAVAAAMPVAEAVPAPAAPEKRFLFARVGGMDAALVRSEAGDDLQVSYRFASGEAGRGHLVMSSGPLTREIAVADGMGQEFELPGTPFKVRLTEYFADFRLQDKKPVSVSDVPNNPGLAIEITGGAPAAAPAPHHGRGMMTAEAGPPPERPELLIRPGEGGRLAFEVRMPSGAVRTGLFEANGSFPGGFLGWQVRTGRTIERGVAEEIVGPFGDRFPEPLGTAGVRVRLDKQGQTHESWFGMGAPTEVVVGGTRARIWFGYRTEPLDFGLKLDRFEVERKEGTMSPASFKSYVRFIAADGSETAREIWMNNPATFPATFGAEILGTGYKFSQASWNPNDLNQTTLQVIRDPGWSLKWLGSLLLCVGLVMVYYFKPKHPRTDHEETPHSAPDRRSRDLVAADR